MNSHYGYTTWSGSPRTDDMKSAEELEREGMEAYRRGIYLLNMASQKRGMAAHRQYGQGIAGFAQDLSGMGMNRYPNQG